MLKRIMAALLSTVLVLGVFAGCTGGGESSSTPDVSGSDSSTPPATSDLSLTVYANVLEDYMEEALKRFSAETGVEAHGTRLGVGETLARIRTEKENPQASVWFGGAAENHIAATEDGLLEPYISPSAADIPAQYKDPDGNWTGFYIGYLGFACNETLIKEAGMEIPTKWEDLLDPRYAGGVSLADPSSSGTSYNLLATLAQYMGEKEAIEYMVALDKNVTQYEKSGTKPAQNVGLGEAMVGITFLHDALKYKEENPDYDMVVSTPSTGTGYEVGSISIVKGGPDQEAAKMFVDWLLKPENLEIGQETGSYQFLTNPNAKSPPIADAIKDAVLIDFDYKYAGENRDRLVEMWSEAVDR